MTLLVTGIVMILWPDSANKTNVSGGSNGVDSSDGIREC